MKRLETERLILRKWEFDDAEQAYTNWATDEEVHKYVSWPIHKDVNETKDLLNIWIKEYENNSYNWVVEIKDTHEIIGNIAVGKVNKKQNTCDLGYCYGSRFWGKGYGKKLFEAGIQELKNMGYDKMVIGCLDGNPSNEFYKHMGGKIIKTRIFEKLQLPENVYYFEKI